MKRIAIINFTGFRGNWGCQATSIELVKFISGCYPAGTPLSFSFVPLLPASKVDLAYEAEIDRVYTAFSDVAHQTDRGPSAVKYLEEACIRRYGFWADIVRRADLVVFQAEGSMGLGATFARGPRLMLLPFVAKHAWGRTVVSLNRSFYSHDEVIRKNAAEAFGSFDFSAFREGASVALARQCGVRQAGYVPDVAFMSPTAQNPWPDLLADGEYFAVSGSALKDPKRYELIMDQVDQIRAATGLKPLLALSRDYHMTLRAWWKWKRGSYAQVPAKASYAQVTGLFANCRFLLSGRYHMSILSAAAGTPNIILTGNSFKNEGLVSLLAAARPVHRFADTDAIVAEACAVHQNRETEARALTTQVDRIRATISNAQDHIARIVAGENPGVFKDNLPEYDLNPAILERYFAYGQGKGKTQGRVLPGARLGRDKPMTAILQPLLDGLASDPDRTLQTLHKLALADSDVGAALQVAATQYPTLNGFATP